MEYFPRSRARRRSSTPPPRVWLSENDVDTPSQSIYIFPNPSAVLPSPSPATSYDTRLDSITRRAAEESRPRSISISMVTATTTDTGWDDLRSSSNNSVQEEAQWQWSASVDGEVTYARLGQEEAVLDEEIVGASRWDLIVSRRYPAHPLAVRAERQARLAPASTMSWIRSRTVSGVGSLSSYVVAPKAVPHSRMRVPLLSFFGTLLDVDEETLDLIESCSTQSVLFHGPLDDSICCVQPETKAHGLALLLKGDECMLREGIRATYGAGHDEKNLDLLSVSTLWRLVGEIWQGRSALRESDAS